MYHPTTRVLTILELLQAHPQLSGAEIARRLEVDRRTVRRYIAMLGDLGIPIEAERGPYGGYRLRPGFKLPPLMLSDEEAFAVTLSLLAARVQHVPARPDTLASVLAKLERILPEPVRRRLQAVQSVVMFTRAAPVPPLADGLVLLLGTAAAACQRVRLCYTSQDQTRERDVDPYGVIRHWDAWYLVGWCHLRAALRIFRLDRMRAATVGAATFVRPSDIDPLAYLLDALATAPWGQQAEILLETDLAAIRDHFPPGSATLEETPGGIVLRISGESLDGLARLLLTLGCPFVIRQPAALRDALAAVGRQAIAMAARTGTPQGVSEPLRPAAGTGDHRRPPAAAGSAWELTEEAPGP